MTTDHDLLVMIDAEVRYWAKKDNEIPLLVQVTEHEAHVIKTSLAGWKALRAAMELVKPYLEHDIKNVAKVDGVYDKEQAEAWEKVHGHDIRLNCYPEFGCQLLIDPEDLFLAIEKELG